jgi:hypothetical protein
MKQFLQTLTIFISILIFCTSIKAQPNFTVYTSGNPVISKGLAGEWDDAAIWFPCVSVINDTFYTTYVGLPDLSAGASIGLAKSTDGFVYNKSSMNPILWGDSSGFDAYAVSGGPLYYDSGTWYLYYSGREIPDDQPGKIISVATAFNPNGPWNRTNDSLLTVGSNGEWDDGNVYPLSIIVEDDSMYLYYWGGHDWDLGPPASQIGLAISNDDGQTWVKWDDPSTINAPFSESDPVIKLGPGSYDDFLTRGACIIKNGAQWEMLYNGSTYPVSGDICYATSDDGIDWNKHASNPILTYLSDPLAINGWFEGSTVAYYNNQYYLYYDYGFGADGIGLATAPPTSIESLLDNNPTTYTLYQNYPNPFNPITNIEFTIPKTEFVTLKIYNVLGQEVITLVSEKLKSGSYKYTWDALDFPSGVYYYRLETKFFTQSKKLFLIR